MKREWVNFIELGEIDKAVRPEVAASWLRCRQFNISHADAAGKDMEPYIYQRLRAANRELIDAALPVMQNIADAVAVSDLLLVLTDSCGYILEIMGSDSALRRAQEIRLTRGVLWCDEEVGTCAIGIALAQDTLCRIAGPEHYCERYHDWVCTAAPIHNTSREVIGCIDVAGTSPDALVNTDGIVRASVAAIEARVARQQTLHIMQTTLDISMYAILVIDKSYRSVFSNEYAREQLGINQKTLAETDIRDLLYGMDWNMLDGISASTRCHFMLRGKSTVYSASIAPVAFDRRVSGYSIYFREVEQLIDAANTLSGNRANYTFADFDSSDASMLRCIQTGRECAQLDGCILIEGETGTGKELFAHAIHNASSRADKPFVVVPCASVPRDLVFGNLFGDDAAGPRAQPHPDLQTGKLEMADGGTIFLDEVSYLPLEIQFYLLELIYSGRLFQRGKQRTSKPLDVRIIASSSRSLRAMSLQRTFRKDLYEELSASRIVIPPLRERPDDIIHIAQSLLASYNRRYPARTRYMDPSLLKALRGYRWPGNIRELQYCIEYIFYTCPNPMLTAQYLPAGIASQLSGEPLAAKSARPLSQSVAQMECTSVTAMLTQCAGDVNAAAEALHISRASLYRKIKKYNLNPKEYRRAAKQDGFILAATEP